MGWFDNEYRAVGFRDPDSNIVSSDQIATAPTSSGASTSGTGGSIGYSDPSSTQTLDTTTSGATSSGDPRAVALAYAQSLGDPSDENLAKTAEYMKSLGYNVTANPGSDGFYLNGVGIDLISNYKGTGTKSWQWLPDSTTGSTGATGSTTSTGGYSAGSYTGGGQYPLSSFMANNGLNTPWTTAFTAPTAATESNDPGYQFRLDEGLKALQRGAASKGTLLTGGTAKGLEKYAQNYASNEYSNVYNRALNEYQQAYNIYNTNQNNLYNRLYGISNSGQNAASGTASANTNYANSASNTLTNQANANAASTVASGNAWGNAASNIGNTASDLYLYNKMYGSSSGTGSTYV